MVRTKASAVSLIAAAVLAAGCEKQEVLTSPSPVVTPPRPSVPTEPFQVTGTVTNQLGIPLEGVRVYLVTGITGIGPVPSAETDTSGRYAVDIGLPTGRRGALLQVTTSDKNYDWYTREVFFANPQIVENVTLRPMVHIQAGDQASVVLTPDNGRCWDSFVGPCARVRVHAPEDGNLTIEAVSTQDPPARLSVVADEVGGNPVTVRVTRGAEVWAEIGASDGATRTVVVKTSFRP